jgi:hypothetical protein
MLDINSNIFYETGVVLKSKINRTSFLKEWLIFIQILIENKIYSNVYDLFQFNKGISFNKDKLLHEPAFIRAMKSIQATGIQNQPLAIFQCLSVEFFIFLCDTIKEKNKMVSYLNFIRKVASNLQNFDINLINVNI